MMLDLMMMINALELQGAVFANPDNPRYLKRNVLDRMSQRASTAIANGHFTLHFNHGLFLNQF